MPTKLEMLISKSIKDIIVKQVALAKTTCAIANKNMTAMLKIDKILQPKIKISTDPDLVQSIQILKLSKDKNIASVTQAVWHYAKVLELSNHFKEIESSKNNQILADKIIRETKLTVVSQQMSTDSFNTYIVYAQNFSIDSTGISVIEHS